MGLPAQPAQRHTLAGQYLKTSSSTTWGQTIVNGVELIGGAIKDSFTPLVSSPAPGLAAGAGRVTSGCSPGPPCGCPPT